MAYVITDYNNRAEGMNGPGVGVAQYTAHVSDQASLADIEWMPPGSYAFDNAMTRYIKCPSTKHWIMPSATPILILNQPEDIEVVVGDISESLLIFAYAQDSSAVYTPTYQWYSCDNAAGSNPSEISGATSSTFAIPTDLTAGTYYYLCTVTANAKTLDSDVATVVVAAE
jgi:hypothetical protein